jgi:hypothetical protein
MRPTAVQAVAEGQDTPMNQFQMSDGCGVVWTDQLVPFQRSTKTVPPGLVAA